MRQTQCLICDYDLRGLDPDGLCPECGTPFDPRCSVARFSPKGVSVRQLAMRSLVVAMLIGGVWRHTRGISLAMGDCATLTIGAAIVGWTLAEVIWSRARGATVFYACARGLIITPSRPRVACMWTAIRSINVLEHDQRFVIEGSIGGRLYDQHIRALGGLSQAQAAATFIRLQQRSFIGPDR